MSDTSSIDATQIEQPPVGTSSPMTWKARICLFVSIGMLLISATLATGLIQGLTQLFNFLVSDYATVLPGLGLAVALLTLFYLATYYNDLFVMLIIRLIPVVLVAAWWLVSTWTYRDGTQPVAFAIIALAFTSTVLLGVCGALHFDESWGRTKLNRLYTLFVPCNIVALIVVAISVGVRIEIEASELRKDAIQAFTKLHSDAEHYVETEFSWDGNRFICEKTKRGAGCVLK